MTDIKILGQDDPEYNEVKELTEQRKHPINYRLLAKEILNSPAGTILTIEAPKKNYSNIKVGLEKRNLAVNTDFQMTFSSKNDKEVFYITVKG